MHACGNARSAALFPKKSVNCVWTNCACVTRAVDSNLLQVVNLELVNATICIAIMQFCELPDFCAVLVYRCWVLLLPDTPTPNVLHLLPRYIYNQDRCTSSRSGPFYLEVSSTFSGGCFWTASSSTASVSVTTSFSRIWSNFWCRSSIFSCSNSISSSALILMR